MSTIETSKSGFTVRIDAPVFKKPLPAPVKVLALMPEQFVGTVEVVRKEVAAAAEPVIVKEPKYRSFQVIPHTAVKNEKIDRFADVLSNSYREIFQRWHGMHLDEPDRVFFETVIEPKSFRMFVTTNSQLVNTIKQHVSMIWKHVTLTDAEPPVSVASKVNAVGFDLKLKRPFFLSLKTDKRLQETPLSEIAELSRSMEESDRLVIQFGFQAAEDGWQKEAEKMAKEIRAKPPKWWNGRNDLHQSSTMKPAQYGYDFVVRVLVESPDDRRRRRLARGATLALKQLDLDNELEAKQVLKFRLKRWLKKMERRNIPVPFFRMKKRQIITGPEIAHFIKLPQKSLQEEYPQISGISKPEVSLPDELFLESGPRINIGTAIEKGVTRMASFPLKAFKDSDGKEIEQKYVDDAYCLPEISLGEMGSGKTGEAIHRAHSAIVNGQTAFFFDTADGAAVKELHDSLPPDYPEEKIIHIDLTNKAWPIALQWAFNPEVEPGDDDAELKAEEAREAGRMFLRQLISGMATSEFTDRMNKYLAVASRAAGSAPLNIELALTSPSYREELLSRSEVQEQLDVVTHLESLQDKARRGSESNSVDGILSRLGVLSEDRFRTNLFFQEPKEPLDFRWYADNPLGGYGYCVTIYCDKNSYGPDGQEAIMTYLLAKVLLEGAYSRVNIVPVERKPFVVLIDEPHRFIRGEMATKLGEDAAVELRKYRCKLNMFAHSRQQLGKLWDAFESGGIQVTLYKSKNVQAFRDLAQIIAPLNPEQAWASLGQHEAVVTRKLPSKREVAFICKMAAPPAFVKDRSARREACARQLGRPWKEVSAEIQARRMEYAQKDQEWYQRVAEEAERGKEERKQARKQRKEVS